MPMHSPETIEKLTFEGPLPLGKLLAVGIIVLVIIGVFTWRECKASASAKRAALLFGPRVIAVTVVFWLLAGATITTLLREFKPKSVVVLADASASMGIVDPVDGSGNTITWSTAESKNDPGLKSLAEAVGTLRSALSALNRIARLSQNPDSNQQSEALWEQVRQSVEAAVGDVAKVSLDQAPNDADSRAELGRVTGFLKSGLTPLRGQGGTSTGSATPGSNQAQADRLEDTRAFLEAALRRVERLAEQLAAHEEQTPSTQQQAGLAAQSKLARRDKVGAWLEAGEDSWLKDLESKARVLRYSFAAKALPVADRGWRQSFAGQPEQMTGFTDLGAALARASQDAAQQSVEAVVLVTDGGHNAAGDPREPAAALRGVPLYIVPIGDRTMPRDVILHHTQCPRTVFKNDNVMFDAMVTAYDCEGEQLHIELLAGSTVVDTKNISIGSKVFDGRVSFQWKAASLGRQQLKVRVSPLAGELSVDNNEAQAEVDVMEDTIRVLIADARPRWEYRYLLNLFKRDKHIDFEQLLFEPKDDSQAGGPSLPRDLEGWRKYRVVILGDLAPDQLTVSQQELLKKFVAEESGNLIVIAGETAMPSAFADQPLAAMLPTIIAATPLNREQGCSLAVTAEGSVSVATQLEDDPLASERLWREMGSKVPIYLSASAQPKPTGHVLISATDPRPGATLEAFLSWQYVGLGRVVYIAAPVTYQLRYQIGDEYHHRFWGQLLRWAIAREMSTGSKTVHLTTDKTSYEIGDAAQLAMRLSHSDGRVAAGAACAIEVRRGGQVVKVLELHEDGSAPGSYRATLDDLPLGPLTLRAAGATVQSLLAEENHPEPVEQVLTVDPKGSTELSNPLCNLPLLKQLADASDGAVLPPAAVPAALAQIDAVPDIQQSVLSRQPAWNRWGYLWIFIGCVTFEWLARKYWRMV
jgi:hypothetical protein